MARTAAVLPGGTRLSDYLSVGVIAQVFPRCRQYVQRWMRPVGAASGNGRCRPR